MVGRLKEMHEQFRMIIATGTKEMLRQTGIGLELAAQYQYIEQQKEENNEKQIPNRPRGQTSLDSFMHIDA